MPLGESLLRHLASVDYGAQFAQGEAKLVALAQCRVKPVQLELLQFVLALGLGQFLAQTVTLGGDCGEIFLGATPAFSDVDAPNGSSSSCRSFPCDVDEFVLGLIARATADRLGHLAHEFADGALIATLWLLFMRRQGRTVPRTRRIIQIGSRSMSCHCEQKIAELRAEVDALRDAFVQILGETVDKCREHLDRVEAKHQMLLARVDERVQRLFARLEAATQSAPLEVKENPPKCH